MKRFTLCVLRAAMGIGPALALSNPSTVRAHCDALDGPVVKSAQQALAKGDVTPVMMWVQKEDEPAVRQAFDNTLAVRRLNDQARELADRYFFETLVRIHRAGEKAPFTGLKAAGQVTPGIAAADAALESGKPDKLVKLLSKDVEEGVRQHFKEAAEKKKFSPNDVAAGREFVKAYVEFTHYVEGIHAAAAGGAHAQGGEPKTADAGHSQHGK